MAFGPFRLYPDQRRLTHDDEPIQIGGRAIDLLIALVDSAGTTQSHAELMARAWPNVTVEPISLRVHISSIRRALKDGEDGARYIVNISGRGYLFVAPVERIEAACAVASPSAVEGVSSSLRAHRVVGREDFIDSVVQQLAERPLVTLVGGGGMGKTAVAVAAADRLGASGARIAFVDLASVSTAALVPVAIASVIGAPTSPGFDVAALAIHVAHRELLLILDGCEHLIDDLAPLVETLRWTAPGLRILATSRESLRVDGEWLMHIPPLDVPEESARGEALLSAASVQLFLDRAIASDERLDLNEQNLAIIGKLCRKLEGIPLAIELVSTRIDLFGLEGLLANLDDRFLLVARGRRTALPRHQTMRATLDWSYDLLTATERKVFRRLSVFRGVFTISQALKVAADDELSELDILEGLPSLAQRSMVARGQTSGQGGYRFFSVNRFYAAEKLQAAGEAQKIGRRHAASLLTVLEQAQAAWPTLPRSAWIARFETQVDDLRAALDWCFNGGDPILGARLAAAWVPVGLHLSLTDEFGRWTTEALACIDKLAGTDPRLEFDVRLLANRVQSMVLGWTPARGEEVEENLKLAERIGDLAVRREAYMSVVIATFADADYPRAREFADRLKKTFRAQDDAMGRLTAERMFAQASHFLGDHDTAEVIAHHLLDFPRAELAAAPSGQMHVDWRVSMRIVLARILWLRGFADQAVTVAEEAVGLAEQDAPPAMAQALGLAAGPIALWRGDLDRAEDILQRAQRHAARSGTGLCGAWTGSFERMILAHRRGETSRLDARLEAMVGGQKHLDHLATVAPAFADAAMVKRVEDGRVGWCAPEILRAHGERMLADDGDPASAEVYFHRAVDLARSQGAVAWQLRAASSLARVLAPRGRTREAASILSEPLDLITEGLGTRDVRAARQALAGLEARAPTPLNRPRAVPGPRRA